MTKKQLRKLANDIAEQQVIIETQFDDEDAVSRAKEEIIRLSRQQMTLGEMMEIDGLVLEAMHRLMDEAIEKALEANN